MKLLIIAPVNTSRFNQPVLHHVTSSLPPDVHVDIWNLSTGSDCIESRVDLATNATAVMQLAQQAEQAGYEGIFVTDMDMCGVDEARQQVRIPVIGGYQASAYTAMLLGRRFAILTLENTEDLQREHARKFGIDTNLATVVPLPIAVHKIADDTAVQHQLLNAALYAIEEKGADSITFGCSGYIAHAEQLAAALKEKTGRYIPVMDPNRCAIHYLILLVRNRLAHSEITYPQAQPQGVQS